MQDDFTAQFGNSLSCSSSDVCACGSDAAAAAIVAKPAHAFHVAAWWFAGGAAQVSGWWLGPIFVLLAWLIHMHGCRYSESRATTSEDTLTMAQVRAWLQRGQTQ